MRLISRRGKPKRVTNRCPSLVNDEGAERASFDSSDTKRPEKIIASRFRSKINSFYGGNYGSTGTNYKAQRSQRPRYRGTAPPQRSWRYQSRGDDLESRRDKSCNEGQWW